MPAASRRQIFSMKIGITTFQWSENYGAVLQAHALQFFLQEREHTVQIIDFRPPPSGSGLRRWLSSSPRGCFVKWEAAHKTHLFESFRKKHLVRTPKSFHSSSELLKLADRFDILITGSDQVWNPQWLDQVAGLWDLYFLTFAGLQTRRVAYAASFGHAEKSTMKKEWQKLIGEKLTKMDAISVREPSGVELVRDLCGRTDALHVLDPTLLLDVSYYKRISRKAKGCKHVFCYMLHGAEKESELFCERSVLLRGLKVVKCDSRKTSLWSGYTLPSPIQWLQRINNAEFVVTNSFHGIVFCLIFHKPFVALPIHGQMSSMNGRVSELLRAVGLPQRMVAATAGFTEDAFDSGINWMDVDDRIAHLRKKSIEFLYNQGL
jgi:hypothetical protein